MRRRMRMRPPHALGQGLALIEIANENLFLLCPGRDQTTPTFPHPLYRPMLV